MRSNNFFTYLLYALLGVLVLAAGYLALDRSKERAQVAEELKKDYEQLNQTIKENGYVDTTGGTSSTYVGESDKTKTTVDKNGIETAPATKSTTTTAKPAVENTKGTSKLVAKGGTTPKQTAPSNTGRYHLVVGAFGQIDNARTEMERFVKMGYRNAEVVKYKTDLWRVIAKRCKTRSEAEKYEGDMARQGIDVMIVDSYKK